MNLSGVELDKFENASSYPDLKVMTVFLGDENLDSAYFKPRALQMKQNIMQRTQNNAQICATTRSRNSVDNIDEAPGHNT